MLPGRLLIVAVLGATFAGPGSAAPLPEQAKDAVKPMLTATSPDGQRLAMADDKTVTVVDAKTQKALIQIQGHTAKVTAVAFSPDGKLLTSGSEDKTVRLYDASTGKALRTFMGSVGVAGLAFSADGKTLTVTGADQSAQRYDVATGQLLGK